MPKDILDVVDTAVKIGLGAVISGVSTYFITRKNQGYELSKEKSKIRYEGLDYAATHIDPWIHELTRFHSKIDGIHRCRNS